MFSCKRIATTLLPFAAVLCLAGGNARTDIERQYKRWSKAALTNDVGGVLSILTPDYTLTTFDKKVVTRAMYEASLRKRKASGEKPAAYTTKMQSLTLSGASARVISFEESRKPTLDPITKKTQVIVHIHQYLDTWVKTGSQWKLRSTVTQVEKTTIAKPS